MLIGEHMKVYYSHAMPKYNKPIEALERNQIRKNLPGYSIVDPGPMQGNIQKQRDGMAYCLALVETCEVLVFTRYKSKITSGVGQEINHGLKKGLDIYELVGGKLKLVKTPVKYLSHGETLELYYGTIFLQ